MKVHCAQCGAELERASPRLHNFSTPVSVFFEAPAGFLPRNHKCTPSPEGENSAYVFCFARMVVATSLKVPVSGS